MFEGLRGFTCGNSRVVHLCCRLLQSMTHTCIGPEVLCSFLGCPLSGILTAVRSLAKRHLGGLYCPPPPNTLNHTHTLMLPTSSLSPLGYQRPTYWHSGCFHVRVLEQRLFTPYPVLPHVNRRATYGDVLPYGHVLLLGSAVAAETLTLFLGWVAACTPHHNNMT